MTYIECPIPKTLSIKGIFTAFKATYYPDFNFSGELHDFWELVMVLDGQIGACAGNNIFTLGKNQAVLHKPMEFHRLWAEGKTAPTVMIFSFDTNRMPRRSNRIFEITPNEMSNADEILKSLLNAFENRGILIESVKEGKEVEAELVIKELEMFLLKLISRCGTSPVADKDKQSKRAQIFSDVVMFLENNIHLRLSVDEISAGCGVSRSNLKKIFEKFAGTGVMAYFNVMKMQAAEQMLKSGSSVNQTAMKLGFDDQYYFSTVFKRVFGKPPSEYIG